MPKLLKQTPLALLRRQRKALRAELARVEAIVHQRLAQAIEAGLIEGRIEDGGEIVIDAPVIPAPRRK